MLDIRRRQNGTYVVTLDLYEALLLRSLPDRLRRLLESPEVDARVARRFFPPAYRDSQKNREYRRLLGDDLRRRKLAGVETFENTLRNLRRKGRQVEIRIRTEEYDLWLAFVNDMRVLLGVELDIRDDDWGSEEFDPESPHAEDLALLHYLSWLEEALISASGFEMPPVDPRQLRPPGRSGDSTSSSGKDS
jgi:hypothetical protein